MEKTMYSINVTRNIYTMGKLYDVSSYTFGLYETYEDAVKGLEAYSKRYLRPIEDSLMFEPKSTFMEERDEGYIGYNVTIGNNDVETQHSICIITLTNEDNFPCKDKFRRQCFECNGLKITRYEFEKSYPDPIDVRHLDDDTMYDIVRAIRKELANYQSFTNDDVVEYLYDPDGLRERDEHLYELIDNARWAEQEQKALEYGARYYNNPEE